MRDGKRKGRCALCPEKKHSQRRVCTQKCHAKKRAEPETETSLASKEGFKRVYTLTRRPKTNTFASKRGKKKPQKKGDSKRVGKKREERVFMSGNLWERPRIGTDVAFSATCKRIKRQSGQEVRERRWKDHGGLTSILTC